MKKGCYLVEFSNCMGGEWKLYTIFNVYNKKDEKLIKELEEYLARRGLFVRLVYDETMTRLMNE